ncbi:MAG TPA: class I SAM-dependent methyltransferase [Bacteroidetes bacterium]|nr:class I SAM-dependent methyltransferase [Bacteroidota bacterium]HCN38097.1 class I SAM-dependent methyltransferase [Bacteroidota bacterium]
MEKNPLERFSDRVDNYIKYRPGYPDKIIDYLETEKILKAEYVIADIGSGTGISCELFLKFGYKVFGVEPNKEMRDASEKLFSGYKNYQAIDGNSDTTNLKNNSIDLITGFQAFHWFDLNKSKLEFIRILKPERYAVFVWNTRKEDSDFLIAYEKLLQTHGTDYKKVKHNNINHKTVKDFFDSEFKYKEFENSQKFDFIGLKGRLLSSSYAPNENDEGYEAMISELEIIFDKYNSNNSVSFDYVTQVYSGKINK